MLGGFPHCELVAGLEEVSTLQTPGVSNSRDQAEETLRAAGWDVFGGWEEDEFGYFAFVAASSE